MNAVKVLLLLLSVIDNSVSLLHWPWMLLLLVLMKLFAACRLVGALLLMNRQQRVLPLEVGQSAT